MSHSKKQYSPQFKAKVALEAIEGLKTIAELSNEHNIHPSVLNKWKRKLIDESVKLFETDCRKSANTEDSQAQIDELYRQIGKLKVERDFLADRSARLGLPTVKPW